jgi:hypothetical protein
MILRAVRYHRFFRVVDGMREGLMDDGWTTDVQLPLMTPYNHKGNIIYDSTQICPACAQQTRLVLLPDANQGQTRVDPRLTQSKRAALRAAALRQHS